MSFFFMVPNCPLYYVGAKLSWCQISGAKLSDAKLSVCQIVRFLTLGAKLSGAKLSGCQIVCCKIVLPPKECTALFQIIGKRASLPLFARLYANTRQS